MTRTYRPRRKPHRPRAMLGAFIVSAMIAVLAAPVLGADPRLDHVEQQLVEKLPGYKRYEAPTTEPTTQPMPELYAEIGGLPLISQRMESGDVSEARGKVLLTGTSYTASGHIHASLYAARPGAAVIQLREGQQITVTGVLAGVVFKGGGTEADDDNTHAAVLVEDGVHLHTVRVTGSQGVGCSIIGKGVKSWYCEFDNNGTIGRGGKSAGDGTPGSGYTEYAAKIHHNNLSLKLKNAANKISRCKDWWVERTRYYDNAGGHQWLDNYNERLVFVDCVFERGTSDKTGEWYKATAFRSELGLPGGVRIIRPVFIDIVGAAIAVNESSSVYVEDPVFGRCKYSVEFRNMLRKDDATGRLKNGKPVDETAFTCRLYQFQMIGATYQPGAGPIVRSGASNTDVRQGRNKLLFGPPRAGEQRIEVPG